jgi:NitT/TauT family transport system ATP-binding protein
MRPGTSGAVAIECDGVALTYFSKKGTPVVALDDVRCRFAPGKVTAIIGPSGCGKSTLLQIARGLLKATAGRLRYVELTSDGPPVPAPAGMQEFRNARTSESAVGPTLRTDERAERAASTARETGPPRMATVWQAFNLFPWRTVLDNVAFGLELAGVPRAERIARARRALAKVDLGGFETKYPRQLSGGMRQRVGLARALVMEPEVLLLDEPFGSLDAQTRLVLQEQLAVLVETSGTTAILVTHSIEEAILLADTIFVMTARPGRIAAEIEVELPRPRSLATTHEPGYALLFDRIYGLLRDEVVRAMTTEAGG